MVAYGRSLEFFLSLLKFNLLNLNFDYKLKSIKNGSKAKSTKLSRLAPHCSVDSSSRCRAMTTNTWVHRLPESYQQTPLLGLGRT